MAEPYQPLGRIDPSSLIGRADTDTVSPRNTALLADAFRQGFVTTDDIMERVGERAQLKRKADIMQMQESMAPLAIEARERSMLAASLKAQADIDLSDYAKSAQKGEYNAKITNYQIENAGMTKSHMRNKAASWGVPVPDDGSKGVDIKWQTETLRREAIIDEMEFAQREAAAVIKAANDPKWFEGNFNGLKKAFPKAFLSMQPISSAQVERANEVLKLSHPARWEQAGKPTVGVFGTTPGQVQGTPSTSAKPDVMSGQPPGTVNASAAPVVVEAQNQAVAKIYKSAKTPAELAQATEAEKQINASRAVATPIVADVPAGIVQPISAAAAGPKVDIIPEGAVDLGPAPGATPVRMASGQQKTLSQAALTQDQFKSLEQSFKTLSTDDAWLTGPISGRLYAWTHPENWNANYASFERAKTAILANLAKGIYHETGVLSDKDIERYSKALPSAKDTPAAAQAKLTGAQFDIYSSVVRNIETMEAQGQVLTPALQKMQDDAAEALKQLPTAASQTPQASPSPVVNIRGGKYKRGPDGLMHPVP